MVGKNSNVDWKNVYLHSRRDNRNGLSTRMFDLQFLSMNFFGKTSFIVFTDFFIVQQMVCQIYTKDNLSTHTGSSKKAESC